jgi:signal transduction histidine kinase
MPLPASLHKRILGILDRYGIVLAGLLIFAYYLWSAIDLFKSADRIKGFDGYFFQFDTLIVLWLLLVVLAKLHEYKKKQKEELETNRKIALEHEKQKMRLELLDDVSAHLTDAINNPLSIISLSAGSLRERFTSDHEIVSFLDRIEGALRRLREVLVDFQRFQTRKIVRGNDGLGLPSPDVAPSKGTPVS